MTSLLFVTPLTPSLWSAWWSPRKLGATFPDRSLRSGPVVNVGLKDGRMPYRSSGRAVRQTGHHESMATRLFISYDFENDATLKDFLVGQSKNDDSPFEFADASVKAHLTGDWKEKVKGRISRADQV